MCECVFSHKQKIITDLGSSLGDENVTEIIHGAIL